MSNSSAEMRPYDDANDNTASFTHFKFFFKTSVILYCKEFRIKYVSQNTAAGYPNLITYPVFGE